ncbi:DUF1697 domain-containing protein [Aestuariivivens sediminicola]|uniref:DUF1697 domain-containing protein n=1 Tax=Aestuariivivens sediminicola TaxID=2913560 RepID=UPI001F56A840|nr:DUF1697 domain-containing protein [Aestuariivivens sediminicola]
MNTYIVLLRGINVSGQKKMPMSELRDMFTSLGFQKVQTYIQSGNVVFESFEEDINALKLAIYKSITTEFGFHVPVLILRPGELHQIVHACPFGQLEKTLSYFMLLFEAPDKVLAHNLMRLTNEKERFVITRECIYFYSEMGYGKSKFNNNFFERQLNVTATTRNYKTMLKLVSLTLDK